MPSDLGSFRLRDGVRKRLAGNCKQLSQLLVTEAQVYQDRTQRSRILRRHSFDLVEIYAGMANISAEALSQSLRVLQPVDLVHGLKLETRRDHEMLREILKDRKPFLVVWEIRCDPWSNIQHLNYTEDQLETIRSSQKLAIEEMCKTIKEMRSLGCRFLLENPWGTPFWQQEDIQHLLQLEHVQLVCGSMCNFGLRGRNGLLMQKKTGWCSDVDAILKNVGIPCNQQHEHEHCLGGNSKRAQVYTRQLARAIVKGLIDTLRDLGDERWISNDHHRYHWVCGCEPDELDSHYFSNNWSRIWSCTHTVTTAEVYYVDIDRTEESWRPLLQEAQLRLQDRVSTSAVVRSDTAFFKQIEALAPWAIHQAQIVRNPKVRRAPYQLLLEKPVTHRAAILRLVDGRIAFESEELDGKTKPGSKFETPVAYAILIYGEAPSSTLNPEDDLKPDEAPGKPSSSQQLAVPPEDQLPPWQTGSRDVTFTVGDDVVPKWVKTVLRRVHTNLGHPTNEALVRHLAQAGATGQALLGAKSLKCAVCERTRPPRQPRPSKAIQSRRFNDRVFMDIIYPKNISGDTFIFLNLLDDASTYQVLDRLEDRREDTVVKALIQGWFRFFGHPDCLVLDAEGAFRGFRFENLVSQAGIKIRFVPPDAHYQLGKAERHGATAKWMMRRLVNQFAACTGDEMTSLANMSMFAKNTLVRRCGASPAQWVYGRQPKIPAALLSEPEAVEAKQSMENSDAYLQIEMARHEAIKCFADFEFDQALRKAMLRKGRPFRGPLEVGQKIAYYRYRNLNDGEGTVEGYRQGMIIGLDPGPSGSVWIRNNRGRVVQASRAGEVS